MALFSLTVSDSDVPPACGDVTADESCLWYERVFYFAHWSPAEGVNLCQEERNPIPNMRQEQRKQGCTAHTRSVQ